MAEPPIVGIVSPPGWYDPTAAEFAGLCAAPVRTQQAIVDVPDLDYDDLDAIAAACAEVERAAHLLGRTGAAAVAMTGTPFVWAGLSTEADIRARQDTIARAAGCPTIMAGTAIVDALRALGVERIAVSTPYYPAAWRLQTRLILGACGFDVRAIRSADEQGLAPDIGSIAQHADASGTETVLAALRRIREEAPDADALVVAGAGVRTLGLTVAAEEELGLPVVASDTAVFRSLAEIVGLPLLPDRLGRMDATLQHP